MEKEFNFVVSDLLEHFSVTHRDILSPSCRMIWFDHMERLKKEKGLYWLMFSKPYHLFVCGFERNIFFLRRNNNISEMNDVNFKLNEMPNGPCIVQIAWGVDFIELDLRIGDKNKLDELLIFTERKNTPPSYPPLELIRWVDKQNLIEKHEYTSEIEFRNKIIAIIKGIQEKVNISSNVNEFWNIIKEGNKIVKRLPKDETDIQAAIIRMISDQLTLANIFVSPEYDTGIGKVDLLFSAQVQGHGICTIVMELKNAHSPDLKDGLNIQLPKYMRNKKSKYGIYLILWYNGDWFSNSKYDSLTSMQIDIINSYLLPEYRQTSNPENITLEVLDLTKGLTASKITK
jgi:hypothetical protein